MTLLVDVGNTALKWARLERGRPADVAAAPHWGVGADEWQARLGEVAPAPSRVVVANVAGSAFATRLRKWTAQQWHVEPEFPVATAEAFGVRNGYARPGALGIDRWLGMLAAWRAAPGPLLVASAGTAFTVDIVDAAGLHRGGCIIPGERLMREALHAQTSGIAAAALLDAAAVEGVFGVNTAGAVQQGARLALASLVDRVARALEAEAGAGPRIVLAGGAADEIAPLVSRKVEVAPNLVLDGLALVASGMRP